jgi:ABC-type transporter Mla MlaB component
MIRVTKTEEGFRTTVTIDGELSRDSIALVETCCRQAESSGKPVHLFLRDVTTVDSAGQVLLRRLASKGVSLEARGVYTSYLVQSLAQDKTEVNGFPINGRTRQD